MRAKTITVGIFEDNPITVAGIRAILGELSEVEVLFSCRNMTDLQHNLNLHQPDILFMDVIIEGMTGLGAFQYMQKEHPEVKRIAFSNISSLTIIKALYAFGIQAFISKNTAVDEIKDALLRVKGGERIVPAHLHSFIGSSNKLFPLDLSERERDVLKGIVAGKSTKDLAHDLFLTTSTIEFHRKNLFQKFEVQNVAELVRLAVQFGDF